LVEFDSPEDKLKISLLTIEKRFVDLENEISSLKKNIQPPAKTEVHEKVSHPDQTDLNEKISNINVRISRLEQELRNVKSRIPVSAAYEDQIKDLLEKTILLETRVRVLEKHITEPHRVQPIILE
jgi:predicted  nucleic acid-binding Zn-ribbon protein